MNTWTDEETSELVTLWPTHSAMQIAIRMHRPHAAICAKANRLRRKGLLPGGEKHFDVVPMPAAILSLLRGTAKGSVPPPPPDDRLAMRPCSLFDLDDRRCHWPLEDPGRMLFCGGPTTARGCPYCAHHLQTARNHARRRTA
jgi:hypothetical protein